MRCGHRTNNKFCKSSILSSTKDNIKVTCPPIVFEQILNDEFTPTLSTKVVTVVRNGQNQQSLWAPPIPRPKSWSPTTKGKGNSFATKRNRSRSVLIEDGPKELEELNRVVLLNSNNTITEKKNLAAAQQEQDNVIAARETDSNWEFDEEICNEEPIPYCDEINTTTPKPKKYKTFPGMCSLSEEIKTRIDEYHGDLSAKRIKFETRLRENKEEIIAREEEKERNKYTTTPPPLTTIKTKQPTERLVRKESLISLPIKPNTNINWKKHPSIPLKMNRAFYLRKETPPNTCNKICISLPLIKDIQYSKRPDIPVRATRTCVLRIEKTVERIKSIWENIDNRVPWINLPCSGVVAL